VQWLLRKKSKEPHLVICDPFKYVNGNLDDLLRVLVCQVFNTGSTCKAASSSAAALP